MSETAHPRVYLVDDDPEVLRSTEWLLQASGFAVASFPDAATFEAGFDPEAPGCVILDIRMPRKDGLTLFEEMQDRQWDIPVIFLTGHGDVPQAVRAMRNGAHHFLEKPYNPSQLIETVDNALAEDAALRERRVARAEASRRYRELTPRQREVACYLAGGFSAKEAARALDMSPKTVEVHRGHILKKMEAGTTVELVHLLQLVDAQFPDR
jgi:FixJ family two-component response regulator